MKKKLFFMVFMMSLTLASYSQTVVLEMDPRVDSIKSKFGKNRKHYTHIIFGFGSIFGATEKIIPIDYWGAWNHNFSILYKRRFNNTYSTGFTFGYVNNRYTLKQTAEKKFPSNFINKHERFVTHGLLTHWFHRINFGKRGNQIGTYLEAGLGYNYYMKVTHITENTVNDYPVEVNTTVNKMFNQGEYSWTIKFGRNAYVFYFSQRISPSIKDENGNPDLPVYTAGMEFGLF